MTAPLLIVAEAQQRRSQHVESDDVDELRRARGRELLIDDDLLDRRTAAATELARPRTTHVAGLVAGGMPTAQDLHPVVQRPRKVRSSQAVPSQECLDLFLQRPLLFCGLEPHRTEIVSVSGVCLSPGQRLACYQAAQRLK